MRVLVVGSGAREHAIAWKLSQSPLRPTIFCAPGNPGTAEIGKNIDLRGENPGALAVWAVENQIDLTVVGPEAPLAAGIVDVFAEHGLRAFGPSKAAARLESSKSFAKEIMLAAGVPTAKGAVFEDYAAAREYLAAQGAPIVIKADGLAAGKGVVVAQTMDEALEALEAFMVHDRLGSAGQKVVIEECLIGQESSVMAIVDGTTVLPLVVSQDYKRIGDGDTGPNTGGMGAISPTPVLGDQRVENIIGEVFIPTLRTLAARGIPYRGFLYAGILVEKSGAIKVLEFNCRLGDPETQVIMMRMRSDLLATLDAAMNSTLLNTELRWHDDAAACIVCASAGYPGEVDDGKLISGLFEGSDELRVFHGGTRSDSADSSKVVSSGGRILSLVARASSIEEAVKSAYEGVEKVSFEGMQFRKDIGAERTV